MQGFAARRLRRLAVLIALAVLAAPAWMSVGDACAEPTLNTIGLLSIEAVGSSPELGAALTNALRRNLVQMSGVRAEVSPQDMVEIKLVFGCVDEKPACLARAGRKLGVSRLLYGNLRPQTDDSTTMTATLMQLNVLAGTIEKTIREAVPARMLTQEGADLDSVVQRWLRELALDGASAEQASRPLLLRPVPNGTPERGSPLRWNRGLWITSIVLGGLAGAAALAAVGTSRGIGEAQDSASSYLDLLQGRLTENRTIADYRDFFESSQQLSNCTVVPGLIGDADYEGYRAVCQHGNTLASTTNGLMIAAGSLAVLSATTLLLARLIRRPAVIPPRQGTRPMDPPRSRQPPAQPASIPEIRLRLPAPSEIPTEEPPPAGESPPPVSLRLDSITPAIGPTGAAFTVQLRF